MVATESNINPKKGIIITIIAFLCFSTMSALIKVCSNAGLETHEIMFFQNLVALIIVIPWVFSGKKDSLKPKNTVLIIGRALVGLLSMYFYFFSIKLIPLVNATLLQNTTPIFIPVIAFFVFRKKITLPMMFVMIAGFIGVALVINPTKGFLDPGDFIALFSGFLSGLSTVVIKILNDKGETVKVVLFYYLIITTIVMGVWSLPHWTTPHGIIWLWLALCGIFYAGFQLLLILAVKYASTTTISPFIYLAVVFSGVLDWLIWHQVPHMLTLIGALIIIVSAISSTIHHTKHNIPVHHK